MKQARKERELHRILIIATGGFGDVMWTMPVIKAIRKRWPRARILVATEEKNMPLFSLFPYADFCVKDDFWNLNNLIHNSDEVFDFGGIATFLKKEMKLDPIEACFVHIDIDLPTDKADMIPHMVVSLDEGKQMEARLKRLGIDPNKDKIIAIGLESSTPNRNWPFSYVKKVTDLAIAAGYKVIWLSESKDFGNTVFLSCDCGWEFTASIPDKPTEMNFKCPVCNKFSKYSDFKENTSLINLGGKTTMRDCMALLPFCSAYIGPNSGLMVMSTSLGVPTIGLFGAFNPGVRTKYFQKFKALWGKTDCAPCDEHWTECRLGYPAPCMKKITPDDVWSDLQVMLAIYPHNVQSVRPIE
jgi:ADP-heptose:LPS heptosyltransferase